MNKEVWRAIKFVLFSMSAGAIQMGSFALMNEFTNFKPWLSYLIALTLSVLWNFTLNRRFTFKSTANVPVAMFKVICYYAVFTPLSTMLEKYLTETLMWNEYLVTFINMFINLVTEFLFQRYVVYGNKVDNRETAKVAVETQKKNLEK